MNKHHPPINATSNKHIVLLVFNFMKCHPLIDDAAFIMSKAHTYYTCCVPYW